MGSHTVQLSAEVVDVYQGTHCVIFLFDPKKEWTFTYIEREIEKVPKNVYILIVVRNDRQFPQFVVVHYNFLLSLSASRLGELCRRR